MKVINNPFSADENLGEHLAQIFGGKFEDNFIKVPEDIYTGTRYFLNCGPGLNAVFVDVEYQQDIIFKHDTANDDFIRLYYDLTNGQTNFNLTGTSYPIGKWNYDLIILDSSIVSECLVKKGSKSLVLCIYIKKSLVKKYISGKENLTKNLPNIFNQKKNTIVRFEKMCNDSFFKLQELQNRIPEDPLFDLHLVATVNFLISNCIDTIEKSKLNIQTVNEADLISIMNAQKYLFENIDKPFPSIETLAKNANMSETKFKNIYKKITHETPNGFYFDCKMEKAKNLLDEESLTISQISDLLYFTSKSYFSLKFKEKFGILPKTYLEKKKYNNIQD